MFKHIDIEEGIEALAIHVARCAMDRTLVDGYWKTGPFIHQLKKLRIRFQEGVARYAFVYHVPRIRTETTTHIQHMTAHVRPNSGGPIALPVLRVLEELQLRSNVVHASRVGGTTLSR